jgi:hypothetical protein
LVPEWFSQPDDLGACPPLGFTTDQNTLGRGNWVNILGHSAWRFMITKCLAMKNAQDWFTYSIEGSGFLFGEPMEESMTVRWI